jgi:hypothetical protein
MNHFERVLTKTELEGGNQYHLQSIDHLKVCILGIMQRLRRKKQTEPCLIRQLPSVHCQRSLPWDLAGLTTAGRPPSKSAFTVQPSGGRSGEEAITGREPEPWGKSR